MSDWVEDVTGCVGPPECPECDRLRAALARAEAELAAIDAVLARRPALADCTTRSDMVSLACHTAGKADSERARADAYLRIITRLAPGLADPEFLRVTENMSWWNHPDTLGARTEAIAIARRLRKETR